MVVGPPASVVLSIEGIQRTLKKKEDSLKRIRALATICMTIVGAALAGNVQPLSPSRTTTVQDTGRTAQITKTSPQQERRDQPVTFNNLPETRLSDVKKVIQVATDRVKSRLKSN